MFCWLMLWARRRAVSGEQRSWRWNSVATSSHVQPSARSAVVSAARWSLRDSGRMVPPRGTWVVVERACALEYSRCARFVTLGPNSRYDGTSRIVRALFAALAGIRDGALPLATRSRCLAPARPPFHIEHEEARDEAHELRTRAALLLQDPDTVDLVVLDDLGAAAEQYARLDAHAPAAIEGEEMSQPVVEGFHGRLRGNLRQPRKLMLPSTVDVYRRVVDGALGPGGNHDARARPAAGRRAACPDRCGRPWVGRSAGQDWAAVEHVHVGDEADYLPARSRPGRNHHP